MLIVGVSGVTNGGKTTLAKALHSALPNSHLMCQDTYFLPSDSKKHTWIPELNHINWEIMSSLDMNKMWQDISNILKEGKIPLKNGGNNYSASSKEDERLSSTKSEDFLSTGKYSNHEVGVLIIEGFLILNYQSIADICHLKYHLTLDKDDCHKRRESRVYDPPDVPGFFEMCVWPEYLKHKEEMLCNVTDIRVIDGTKDIKEIFQDVFGEIINKLEHMKGEEKELANMSKHVIT